MSRSAFAYGFPTTTSSRRGRDLPERERALGEGGREVLVDDRGDRRRRLAVASSVGIAPVAQSDHLAPAFEPVRLDTCEHELAEGPREGQPAEVGAGAEAARRSSRPGRRRSHTALLDGQHEVGMSCSFHDEHVRYAESSSPPGGRSPGRRIAHRARASCGRGSPRRPSQPRHEDGTARRRGRSAMFAGARSSRDGLSIATVTTRRIVTISHSSAGLAKP